MKKKKNIKYPLYKVFLFVGIQKKKDHLYKENK